MIYGPPGTGKTTRLIQRVEEFVADGVPADSIAVVSFTRAAAAEIATRATVNKQGAKGVQASTIHSLAFRLAGLDKSQIITTRELKEFAETVGIPCQGNTSFTRNDATMLEGDEYLSLISYAANQLIFAGSAFKTKPAMSMKGNQGTFSGFCYAYGEWKDDNNLVDFTDVLVKALDNETPLEYEVLIVDEAQDLSPLQWLLINKWAETMKAVVVAGDDDQSIYEWGGADPQGMATFQKDNNATYEVLNQSYRLPSSVHDLAVRLITSIPTRVDKQYAPRDYAGTVNYHNYRLGEALPPIIDQNVPTMILYRNHSFRKKIEQAVIEQRIPYRVDSGSPGVLQSPGSSAVRLWEGLFVEDLDDEAFFKIIKKIKPRVKAYIMEQVEEAAKAGEQAEREFWTRYRDVTWDEVLTFNEWSPSQLAYFGEMVDRYGLFFDPKLTLSTFHAVKGREADHVIVLDSLGSRTFESYQTDRDPEIRAMYVAITRAKKRLDVLSSTNPVLTR